MPGTDSSLDAARERYEDIVRQIERQDTRSQHYVSTCAVLNLAIAAAAGSVFNSGAGSVRSGILLALCGAGGLLLTTVINHYIYRITLHFRYLAQEFLALEARLPGSFISPFAPVRPGRALLPENWSRITFLFLLLWIAVIVTGAIEITIFGLRLSNG